MLRGSPLKTFPRSLIPSSRTQPLWFVFVTAVRTRWPVRRYAHLVRSVALRILQDGAEADDLLQEVFLFIQRQSGVFDSSKSSARSFKSFDLTVSQLMKGL